MTSIAVVENQISSVKKYLKILSRYLKYSRKEIENDIDLRGAVERYLYLAVQATIDLAESVVAHQNFRKPSTMSEAFDVLLEEKVLGKALRDRLVQMTGFRNVIAHDYEDMDYKIVFHVLHAGLRDIEKFLRRIEKQL